MRRSRIVTLLVLAAWFLPALGGAVAAPLHAASHASSGGGADHHHGGLHEGLPRVGFGDPSGVQDSHGSADHHHAHGDHSHGAAPDDAHRRTAPGAAAPAVHGGSAPVDPAQVHSAHLDPARAHSAQGASPSGDPAHRHSTRVSPAAPADPPRAAVAAWIQALLHGHHHGASDPGHEHPANPSTPHVPGVSASALAFAGPAMVMPSRGAGAVLRPGPEILPSTPLLHTLCSYLL